MTETKEANDMVLKSARGILIFTKWLLVLGVGGLVVGIPSILIFADKVTKGMADVFVAPAGTEVVWMIAGIMMFAVVMLLLTLFSINRLRRIVDSVAEGNPFTRINGTRLRGMGVAVFAIQVVTFFGGVLATTILTTLGEVKPDRDFHMSIDGGISVTGILLVLLLIILARVFDRGADMQDELEGTI
ncbi:MAG: DUF2975 domain-containing protein [Parasphingorhabdus sp.]|uniref:DUF2975 domain-containing protein n=1 Tax=Parasphingorhabdus sp. TaxID=2709688 RepID=UPI0032982BA9